MKLKIIFYLSFQITKKFRDEMAPKYGLLRGREFEMKGKFTCCCENSLAKLSNHILKYHFHIGQNGSLMLYL